MRLIDALQYRLPLAGVVSILHRASGLILFLLLPFIIWLFDKSVTSEMSYAEFTSTFVAGWGFLPGWFMKVVVLGLIWAYLHHFAAGIRYLVMDAFHTVSKAQGRQSAIATLVFSLLLTAALGYKLFMS